ncbi:hypothetical protein CWI37_1095p0010 [Hamiltosporidium tvaerminnensis]|uniref:Uncharacterized protein n=1 Tax=Hamiltosporidium tvaerminnensis TaxID=1176355 RepID=A0A4Q9KYT8_9MICR|nr:hypothetical protein CWI37_1095p0010 [Hamiltosporidium tvaerminnensis]
MYFDCVLFLLNASFHKKKCKKILQLPISFRNYTFIILICRFLRPNNCIRIVIDFERAGFLENPATEKPLLLSLLNSYSRKKKYGSEIRSLRQFQPSFFASQRHFKVYSNQIEYHVPNAKNILPSESDIIEHNIEGIAVFNNKDFCIENLGDTEILLSEDTDMFSFDYSDDFIIKSKYFDELKRSGNNEIKLNIKDITKSNIDCVIFEECMNILKNGWNLNFAGLKKEEFLGLIWLLYDLTCYSDSDALLTFYKNLLPFIFLYLQDRSNVGVSNLTGADFINYNKYFLPFLYLLYETIDITYNSNRKELVLVEKKQNKNILSFEKHNIDEIMVRITPIALELISQENSKDKFVFLNCIVYSFKIKGIKISSDDIYFTEFKDLDFACNNITKHTTNYEMRTSFISIFSSLQSIKNNEITYVEFERLELLSTDYCFLETLKNLDSLILVKCNTSLNFLLCKLSYYFPKLRKLHIVGFLLLNGFFNHLHALHIELLDLSCCIYNGSSKDLNALRNETLKELRANYSRLNYKILQSFMLCKVLKFLNHENWQNKFQYLDLSYSKLNQFFSEYFSSNIQVEILYLDQLNEIKYLKRILSQKSLHTTTKKLSLSKNLITRDILTHITAFEVLQHINLSFSTDNSLDFLNSEYVFASKLVDLDLSGNKLELTNLSFIYQFDCLSRLNLCHCDLSYGFMSHLSKALISSLREINLCGNKLCSSDISQIFSITNLVYLVITLDNKVFSEFLKEYGILKCLVLETLVLVNTNVDSDIENFIISQPILKNVELRGCKVNSNSQIMKININPLPLEDIV